MTDKTEHRQLTIENWGTLGCSGKISISCFSFGMRRGTLVINLAIKHELENDRIIMTTSEIYTL